MNLFVFQQWKSAAVAHARARHQRREKVQAQPPALPHVPAPPQQHGRQVPRAGQGARQRAGEGAGTRARERAGEGAGAQPPEAGTSGAWAGTQRHEPSQLLLQSGEYPVSSRVPLASSSVLSCSTMRESPLSALLESYFGRRAFICVRFVIVRGEHGE